MILFLGSGFIANALSKTLSAAGRPHRVVSKDVIDDPPFQIQTDICSLTEGSAVFDDVDTAIYFAHSSVPYSSMQNILQDAKDNILSAIALLEILAKKKIRVIYISSGGSVYGNQEGVTTEDALPTPVSAYGVAKYAIENYIRLFHHNHQLPYDILRFSNVYGVGQHTNKPQGITSALARAFVSKEEFQIWGDGTAKKDYLYIDDGAEALAKVVSRSASNETFNISYGSSTSIGEIITLFEDFFGYAIEIKVNEPFDFDVQNVFLDNKKFKHAYAWEPMIGIESGIRRTAEWFAQRAK